MHGCRYRHAHGGRSSRVKSYLIEILATLCMKHVTHADVMCLTFWRSDRDSCNWSHPSCPTLAARSATAPESVSRRPWLCRRTACEALIEPHGSESAWVWTDASDDMATTWCRHGCCICVVFRALHGIIYAIVADSPAAGHYFTESNLSKIQWCNNTKSAWFAHMSRGWNTVAHSHGISMALRDKTMMWDSLLCTVDCK